VGHFAAHDGAYHHSDHDHCAGHSHGRSHSQRCEGADHQQSVRSNAGSTHSHSCAICEYLSQVRGAQTQLATAVVWQPIAGAVVCWSRPTHKPAILNEYAPRGPPALRV
jgi:hypothetical protein